MRILGAGRPALAALIALGWTTAALAQATSTAYGTLSNFDVFNGCGQPTEGFEIQLDGVAAADVVATFGAPYQRYGNPTLTTTARGVVLRYSATFDKTTHTWSTATPIPPEMTPTAGHSCWTGGSAGYLTSGCEHFGVALSKNPTATHYRWLVPNAARPGTLTRCLPDVTIPAPVWNVVVKAPDQPPVVEVQIKEVEKAQAQYSNAQWVKVYYKEVPQKAQLNELLTDDPLVPQDAAETETEWELLQAGPPGSGSPNGKKSAKRRMASGDKSVVRRYEFYKYTGAYDPESHEARCAVKGCKPAAFEIGPYIGAQMAGVVLQ